MSTAVQNLGNVGVLNQVLTSIFSESWRFCARIYVGVYLANKDFDQMWFNLSKKKAKNSPQLKIKLIDFI